MEREYLGDGLYVEIVSGQMVRLFTNDGLRDTNEVFLEPEVLTNFLKYVDKYRENRTVG